MTNIKSRYIKEKTVKLIKKYFNEYEKAIKLMQQTYCKEENKFIEK